MWLNSSAVAQKSRHMRNKRSSVRGPFLGSTTATQKNRKRERRKEKKNIWKGDFKFDSRHVKNCSVFSLAVHSPFRCSYRPFRASVSFLMTCFSSNLTYCTLSHTIQGASSSKTTRVTEGKLRIKHVTLHRSSSKKLNNRVTGGVKIIGSCFTLSLRDE